MELCPPCHFLLLLTTTFLLLLPGKKYSIRKLNQNWTFPSSSLDLIVELAGLALLLDFGFKEILRSSHAHLLHIDLGESSQLVQATVCGQFSGVCLPEDQQEFTERDLAVLVLVHLLYHLLQAQMRLRCTQFLHHYLELGQVQETVLADVVSGIGREGE